MEKELQKNISYILQFISSIIFMGSYEILSIIFLKEFIKLNVNTDSMIKNVKRLELYAKYATVFLKTQTLESV